MLRSLFNVSTINVFDNKVKKKLTDIFYNNNCGLLIWPLNHLTDRGVSFETSDISLIIIHTYLPALNVKGIFYFMYSLL